MTIRATINEDIDTTGGLIPAGTVVEGEVAIRFLSRGLATLVPDPAPKVERAVSQRKTK